MANVVGRVITNWQVDAIIAVEQLSHRIEICPIENPAGGGLLGGGALPVQLLAHDATISQLTFLLCTTACSDGR